MEQRDRDWDVSFETLRFWADEAFPGGTWTRTRRPPGEGQVRFKRLSSRFCLVFRTRFDWEVDLLEGGWDSDHAVVVGIDLDPEHPHIEELRGWLWEARGAFAAHAGGPKVLTVPGPLSEQPLSYLGGTEPLELCTDLTQLDWGRRRAAVLRGPSGSGKTLIAYRIARDFLLRGDKVAILSPHPVTAQDSFRSRWGVEPTEVIHTGGDIDGIHRVLVDRQFDLVVVDLQVPGLGSQPLNLAREAHTRVLWTFKWDQALNSGARRKALYARKAVLLLESQGADKPFRVAKFQGRPRNYRVLPGLEP